MGRSGLSGPGGSLNAGFAFGIPPIVKFGSKDLQERFLPDLLTGKKRACIAITEPEAGSDVANIATTAVKSADGQHYILNGTKKWFDSTTILRLRQFTDHSSGSPTEFGRTMPPCPCGLVHQALLVSPCLLCP